MSDCKWREKNTWITCTNSNIIYFCFTAETSTLILYFPDLHGRLQPHQYLLQGQYSGYKICLEESHRMKSWREEGPKKAYYLLQAQKWLMSKSRKLRKNAWRPAWMIKELQDKIKHRKGKIQRVEAGMGNLRGHTKTLSEHAVGMSGKTKPKCS